MINKGNHIQMALIQVSDLVKYYDLPRYLSRLFWNSTLWLFNIAMENGP